VTARRYSVQFRPAALRQLRKLPTDALRRIQAATENLRDEPRPDGAAKLAGTHDLVADDVLVVTVVRIGHRREVYRR
jgi:mRNA interferase RelE/StbE